MFSVSKILHIKSPLLAGHEVRKATKVCNIVAGEVTKTFNIILI